MKLFDLPIKHFGSEFRIESSQNFLFNFKNYYDIVIDVKSFVLSNSSLESDIILDLKAICFGYNTECNIIFYFPKELEERYPNTNFNDLSILDLVFLYSDEARILIEFKSIPKYFYIEKSFNSKQFHLCSKYNDFIRKVDINDIDIDFATKNARISQNSQYNYFSNTLLDSNSIYYNVSSNKDFINKVDLSKISIGKNNLLNTSFIEDSIFFGTLDVNSLDYVSFNICKIKQTVVNDTNVTFYFLNDNPIIEYAVHDNWKYIKANSHIFNDFLNGKKTAEHFKEVYRNLLLNNLKNIQIANFADKFSIINEVIISTNAEVNELILEFDKNRKILI